jgi:protein involved in polysaccharide export with SLBB domain
MISTGIFGHQMKHGSLRRSLSLFLVVSLLAPSLGTAQPSPSLVSPPPIGTQPTPSSGATIRPAQPTVSPNLSPAPAPVRGTMPGPDYRLGPGDILDVQIAGRLDIVRQQVVVDPEGTINSPPLGGIPVGGATLLEAHRRVAARAREVFRFAEATITVVTPRTFEVVVSGEVERPGSYSVTALRRVHDIILEAGGITSRGSSRRVVVTRGATATTADLLAFQVRGDLAQNPAVQEGIKIHVPPRGGSVTLSGAVRRPGDYEIGATPSLRALLDLAGGIVQPSGDSEARLTRLGDDGRKATVPLDLRAALAPPADFLLQPGDAIYVPPGAVIQGDLVELRGAFNGTAESTKTQVAGKATILERIELAQGDRVRDVVTRAGGATAYADLRLALVERSGASGPRQRIPIDLYRMFVEKDDTPNILLQNGDVVLLPIAEDRVFILGEVKTPGGQDFRPDFSAREYVALAGGATNRGRLDNTVVTFRNGKTYPMADAPPLEPGAVVTVPEVAVKWWQDYVTILSTIATLATAYTGLYFIFHGQVN